VLIVRRPAPAASLSRATTRCGESAVVRRSSSSNSAADGGPPVVQLIRRGHHLGRRLRVVRAQRGGRVQPDQLVQDVLMRADGGPWEQPAEPDSGVSVADRRRGQVAQLLDGPWRRRRIQRKGSPRSTITSCPSRNARAGSRPSYRHRGQQGNQFRGRSTRPGSPAPKRQAERRQRWTRPCTRS
jgi:hypothetical protein